MNRTQLISALVLILYIWQFWLLNLCKYLAVQEKMSQRGFDPIILGLWYIVEWRIYLSLIDNNIRYKISKSVSWTSLIKLSDVEVQSLSVGLNEIIVVDTANKVLLLHDFVFSTGELSVVLFRTDFPKIDFILLDIWISLFGWKIGRETEDNFFR